MNDAETAYKTAEAAIEHLRTGGGVVLVLSGEAYNALNRLPESFAHLTALTVTEEDQDNVVGALKRGLNE
jgi:hypothetical protein